MPVAGADGRRERKKRQTRTRIQDAALELFATRGYRDTTIAAIADHADVATRTVTLHFPAKEDLLFADDPFTPESLGLRLRSRGPKEGTLEVLRDWMHATMRSLDASDAEEPQDLGRVWQRRALRSRLLMDDDDLRGRARAGYRDLEQLVAAGIGEDVGQAADALLPRLAASTVVGGLREIYATREAQEKTGAATSELFDLVDGVLAFARAGIAELSPKPA
ncbi:TetR family transcriptional regulator [Actinoallomurus bryophytorum]|uniref:TetR family transcriptional regulator n=2 Tax=Actinoallomurus bryophytorum TaxID=1490222 RepID=A0A543C121_9ACTN|nr:TetR family transcriptional regulator [Actinoallomurus bryophytorum]